MKSPTILMVRPVRFAYNAETAVNNAFQVETNASDACESTAFAAQKQFDQFVEILRQNQIKVLVVQDTEEPHTPDSIFPNNWMSTHHGGMIVLYPMFAKNRRLERKKQVLETVASHFKWNSYLDFSDNEEKERYLEGTGSFVLDRRNQYAFACLSPRTDEQVFREFCDKMDFEPVIFNASDRNGVPIYHTNVMMCVAENYVVINLDCILTADRRRIEDVFKRLNKEIVPISMDQMEHFAGNMLQVYDQFGKTKLVMSTQAWNSLGMDQQSKLKSLDSIVHAPLDVIEMNGGGSARCMMAEIYLEPKDQL